MAVVRLRVPFKCVSGLVQSSGTKRKMVKIDTHSGSFHCDAALGCWMLQQTAALRDPSIVRTRDVRTRSRCVQVWQMCQYRLQVSR
jgi:uncharacterized UPF0160 family protein